MKKRIAVLTGTRAEYGLLLPVLKRIMADDSLELKLIVTGMHLCPEFGLTYEEIEKSGIPIDEKIEIVLSSDTPEGMTKSMGLCMISFADYFKRVKPDLLIVLGDRYEAFAVSTAAAIAQIPIAHLYGGDTTEGAVDEFLRHSITKMSHLHFTSTKVYKHRVEQLGEAPERVFHVGALGIENILNMPLMSKEELEESISFKLDKPYALVTFHPVTMEGGACEEQVEALLKALAQYPDIQFIITKANSDAMGRKINALLEGYVQTHSHAVCFASLGLKRYLSAMKGAAFVIGNSSSGIYETPSFNIPTINIGNRQKGRLQGETIINCMPEEQAIIEAIEKAMSEAFKEQIKEAKSPYEGVCPSKEIVETIKAFLEKEQGPLSKRFYDIEV